MTSEWLVSVPAASVRVLRPFAGSLFAIFLFLAIPSLLSAQPFTLDEVLAALRSGKPPQPELVRQVSTRHVGFVLSPAAQKQLLDAGATEQLLQAIKFNPELPRSYVPGSSGKDTSTAAQPASARGWGDPPKENSSPTPAASVSQEAPSQEAPPSDDDSAFRAEAIVDVPTGPITPHEINDLLVAGEDQATLIATISLRGVSFGYTPDLGRAWRDLGATPDLLAALATARVTLPSLPEGFVQVPVARSSNYDETAVTGYLDLRLHVDDIVEVRLQGDRVVWKTLKGSDGKDDGSVWSQPFPMGPVRSLNVDKRRGRGQFVVMQQPTMENDFEMMLRIYDPQGGAARYHLRFNWQH